MEREQSEMEGRGKSSVPFNKQIISTTEVMGMVLGTRDTKME